MPEDNNSNMPDRETKLTRTVIAGAGPAGLTAGYLLADEPDMDVIVFEATDKIGGISRTERYKGNRIDIGGHRFFSKNSRVNRMWEELIPSGGDAETVDEVMLRRRRVSRIYYLRRFFDYPVRFDLATVRNLGLGRTVSAGMSYLCSAVVKRPENSLEDFYINRFGRRLYEMFFEDYTEKVWGKHPSALGADWGAQRVKGLSLLGVLKDFFIKSLNLSDKNNVETSLIEEFDYPKYGPGQLWERAAERIISKGGHVETETEVEKIHISGNRVVGVTVRDSSGRRRVECDTFLSSMPLKELIEALDGVDIPEDIARAAAQLPYRDFVTVGLLVNRLKIRNSTRLETYRDRIPDTWIYVQERDVRLGRIQVFNNWSPYMVKEDKEKIWLGLEYFCTEGDNMWEMDDKSFIDMAVDELVNIGIIDADSVEDAVRIKVKKAYPAYYGSYSELPKIRKFLDSIEGLYCIGRNGQHRYNNMDHSMLTAMEAVDLIKRGEPNPDRSNVWNVNTEEEYHETVKKQV